MFDDKKRLLNMISSSFGKDPTEGISYYNGENRMGLIRRYHRALAEQEGNIQVDDITWEDLEMDRVFLRINRTECFAGEQYLYHRLHETSQLSAEEPLDTAAKSKRDESRDGMEKRLSFFEANEEDRIQMESRLLAVGKQEGGYYLPEFLLHTDLWQLGNTRLCHFLQLLLLALFVAALVMDSAICLAACSCVGLINLVIYLRAKQKYEVYFTSLMEFKKVYEFAKWMKRKYKNAELIPGKVRKSLQNLRGMNRVIMIMGGRRQASAGRDVLAMAQEYLWGILLIDVSLFDHIMKAIGNRQEDVWNILEFVGRADSELAILSYRKSLSRWCRPEWIEKGMEVQGIAHPLLKDPVVNDFSLQDRAIITGSNASGKSTFMKSLAVNCILAASINTCTAEAMRLQPLTVVTCMALRDDILSGESYYYREAKCLKRILDLIEDREDILVVIDEILKGTNTIERVAASKAILDYLGKQDSLTLVATHDHELTETELYHNYHFCSKIEGDRITFDYRIREGRNGQSNAIALLAHLGYPKEIVEKARANCHANR